MQQIQYYVSNLKVLLLQNIFWKTGVHIAKSESTLLTSMLMKIGTNYSFIPQ